MKKLTLLFALLISTQVFAVDTVLKTDSLKLGNPSNPSANKVIEFNSGAGAANSKIQKNGTTGKMQFSNDGTNFKNLGSGSGGGAGGINLMAEANPDFEDGTTGYTWSSGGTLTIETSDPLDGEKSAIWTPSAAGQTLTTAVFNVTKGVQGGGCEGDIFYQTDEATNPYSFQVYDGSNNPLAQPITLQALTSARMEHIYFTCPTTGGSVQMKILANASVAPTDPINLDDLHLGSITTGSEHSQTMLFGSAHTPITGGCSWSTISGTYVAFAAEPSCPTPTLSGNALAPATKIPAIKFANLPAGEYRIEVTGHFQVASASTHAHYKLYDGTNQAKEENTLYGSSVGNTTMNTISGTFSYATAQSNVTFEILSSTGSTAYIIASSDAALTFNVYYYPSVSQIGYSQSTVAASWSGYHDQCYFPGASPTYADPTPDAGCSLVQTRNVNFGSVTSYQSGGSALPGIVFSAPKIGTYKVCATFAITTGTSGRTSVLMIDSSGAELNKSWNLSTTSVETAGTVCGETDVTSLAPWTVKLQSANVSSTTHYISSPSALVHAVTWTIHQLDAGQPAPVFPGNVSSSYAGSVRTEFLVFGNIAGCTTTPCPLETNSGPFTVARTASGHYDISIAAGTFSGTPSCTCNVSNYPNGVCSYNGVVTSTSIPQVTLTRSDLSGAYADLGVSMTCHGFH